MRVEARIFMMKARGPESFTVDWIYENIEILYFPLAKLINIEMVRKQFFFQNLL